VASFEAARLVSTRVVAGWHRSHDGGLEVPAGEAMAAGAEGLETKEEMASRILERRCTFSRLRFAAALS